MALKLLSELKVCMLKGYLNLSMIASGMTMLRAGSKAQAHTSAICTCLASDLQALFYRHGQHLERICHCHQTDHCDTIPSRNTRIEMYTGAYQCMRRRTRHDCGSQANLLYIKAPCHAGRRVACQSHWHRNCRAHGSGQCLLHEKFGLDDKFAARSLVCTFASHIASHA